MRRELHKSRLKKHLQEQAFKNVWMAVFGVVIIIVLLVIFGTNILVGFSLLVGKFTGGEETSTDTQKSKTYIAPPTLDETFEATSSATVTLSGYGEAKQRISLFREGKVLGKTTVKSNGNFEFNNIELKEGDNIFKARTVTDENKHSEYSNEIQISLLNKPPELSVDEPKEGHVFKKDGRPVKVQGKTNSGVKVTVNDFRAIVDDEGNYSYLYTLKDGDNDLKIVATDMADNKTTKELKIRAE